MVDVIIVGARCAGSPLAMLLARKGARVLVLDRDGFPSDMTMSTHIVHARGISLLHKWGLFPAVAGLGCRPILGARLDFGAVVLQPKTLAVDGIRESFAPRRLLLDDLLIHAAREAGAEVRERTKVEALVSDDGRVTGVRGRSDGGATFEERARFVIGADGPGSCVAREVGAAEYETCPALQGTLWTYWAGVSWGEEFRLYQRDGEAVYGGPTSEEQVLIGINLAIDRFKRIRGDLGDVYRNALARIAPELYERVRGARQTDRFFLGATRGFFRVPRGPGWVLIGDAGYKKDPCTAQGMTDAFLDADRLADALEAVLGGREPEESALARFHRERDEWAMPFYRLTCDMARMAPPPPEMLPLLEALRGRPDEASRFAGMITTAVSPAEFLAPENLRRIIEGH